MYRSGFTSCCLLEEEKCNDQHGLDAFFYLDPGSKNVNNPRQKYFVTSGAGPRPVE